MYNYVSKNLGNFREDGEVRIPLEGGEDVLSGGLEERVDHVHRRAACAWVQKRHAPTACCHAHARRGRAKEAEQRRLKQTNSVR